MSDYCFDPIFSNESAHSIFSNEKELCVSHNLRTPLTTISGIFSLALENEKNIKKRNLLKIARMEVLCFWIQ